MWRDHRLTAGAGGRRRLLPVTRGVRRCADVEGGAVPCAFRDPVGVPPAHRSLDLVQVLPQPAALFGDAAKAHPLLLRSSVSSGGSLRVRLAEPLSCDASGGFPPGVVSPPALSLTFTGFLEVAVGKTSPQSRRTSLDNFPHLVLRLNLPYQYIFTAAAWRVRGRRCQGASWAGGSRGSLGGLSPSELTWQNLSFLPQQGGWSRTNRAVWISAFELS